MDELESQIQKWERRGVYDDPKLTDISKMYEELGFTVRLDPFRPEKETGCKECMRQNPDKYKVLFIKKCC
ncbi:MAG: hypothetical protein GY699_09125 [Desulfobacteraceae bacterium]|nr:hypothetical protein [Desulfobacteraceae bacterium]